MFQEDNIKTTNNIEKIFKRERISVKKIKKKEITIDF